MCSAEATISTAGSVEFCRSTVTFRAVMRSKYRFSRDTFAVIFDCEAGLK
jgi:hypothetical protein